MAVTLGISQHECVWASGGQIMRGDTLTIRMEFSSFEDFWTPHESRPAQEFVLLACSVSR
jgi:hypothetical protein